MSPRAANILVLTVGLFVVVGVLYLAGCFANKISASRAAALLRADGGPTWRRVTCKPYTGSYWDYICRVDLRRGEPFSFEVKVNGNDITDQSAP